MSTDTSEEWDFAAAARGGWREDTITSFPAIRDDDAPADSGTCKCGMPGCPDSPDGPGEPAGRAVLLSCAEGVTSRIWRTRVASGEWPDIPAGADQGHARVHLPALDGNRRIRAGVAAGRHDIAAVFRADPSRLDDGGLKAGLDRLAAELAGRLADLEAMGYRAWASAHPAEAGAAAGEAA